MLAAPPAAEVAEPPARPVAPMVLSEVLAAIRDSRALHAVYQSFSSPEPRRRVLEPHALVFDGFRWHARARDVEDNRFRDFVLGRLSDARLGEAVNTSPNSDSEWNSRLELEIAPHPDLAPHQRKAIAADYGMVGERLTLRPRVAVSYYVKRRLGLTEGHQARPAWDQHIILMSERIIPPMPP